MKTKLRFLGALALLAFLFGFSAQPAVLQAEDLSPLEIMRKVDRRDDGETSIAEMTMVLVDRRGNQRVRQMKSFRKDYGEDTKSISFFLSPADVKNTGLMSFDYDDDEKEDDNWLYLPALRKVKRIAAGNKKDSFMGSDFTYVDMNGLKIGNWDYKFLKKSEMVDGQDCWVIEAVPKQSKKKEVIENTGYLKRVAWVRKDNFIAVRGKVWVKKGKKIKYMEAKEIEKIQGIWTAKKLEMKTTKGNRLEHSTILLFNNTVYNQGVDDNMFTTQRLERGL